MGALERDVMSWNDRHSFNDLHHSCDLSMIRQADDSPGLKTLFNRLAEVASRYNA